VLSNTDGPYQVDDHSLYLTVGTSGASRLDLATGAVVSNDSGRYLALGELAIASPRVYSLAADSSHGIGALRYGVGAYDAASLSFQFFVYIEDHPMAGGPTPGDNLPVVTSLSSCVFYVRNPGTYPSSAHQVVKAWRYSP
jgi:hypothetical protein